MYLKYLKHVLIHKWYVFIECCRITKDPKYKIQLIFLGIIHDFSKFRPSEFIPYARFFYGNYEGYARIAAKKKFNKAWLHHIHRNKHHWQYWLLYKNSYFKNIPIPVKYMLEMVADWRGAGQAIHGEDNILEWYNKNKHKISINKIQRKFIESKIQRRQNEN